MPEDYYSDAAPAAQTATEAPEAPESAPETDASDSATTVIPMEVTGGKEFNPGDEIVLEVVQKTEDGLVVKYASEKPDEYEKEPEAQAEAPMPAGGGMASMME